MAIARALLRTGPAAEDVVQESFVAAHRHWERIAGYEDPGAWVRRVLINRATSLRRRWSAEERAMTRLAGHADDTLPELSAQTTEVWDQVRRLPRRQAQATILHYVGQLTVDEIGVVMGCSTGAVKSHLHRARTPSQRSLGVERGDLMKHLDDIERRLHQAAEETRTTARQSVPPSLVEPERSSSAGWLIFAGAFALVVLAVGVVPMLTPLQPSRAGSTRSLRPRPLWRRPPPLWRRPRPALPRPSPTVPPRGSPCPGNSKASPAPVAETRLAIAEAAIGCDFDTLRSIAGPELNTSFGGGGFDNIPRWEDDGTYPALSLLVRLLDLPYASEEYEDLPTSYYWPRAFVYDSWEEIPAEDLADLQTIYTEQEIEDIAAFGAYAGWRVGITEDGDWRSFVAGD